MGHNITPAHLQGGASGSNTLWKLQAFFISNAFGKKPWVFLSWVAQPTFYWTLNPVPGFGTVLVLVSFICLLSRCSRDFQQNDIGFQWWSFGLAKRISSSQLSSKRSSGVAWCKMLVPGQDCTWQAYHGSFIPVMKNKVHFLHHIYSSSIWPKLAVFPSVTHIVWTTFDSQTRGKIWATSVRLLYSTHYVILESNDCIWTHYHPKHDETITVDPKLRAFHPKIVDETYCGGHC